MHEQQNIEYKSSCHDDHLKWIYGFANAQTPYLKGNIFITAGQRPADRERTANRCLQGRTCAEEVLPCRQKEYVVVFPAGCSLRLTCGYENIAFQSKSFHKSIEHYYMKK
jgi:hypothetical protein